MGKELKIFIERMENFPINWFGIFLIAGAVIAIRILGEAVLDKTTVFSYWTLIFLGSWFLSLFIAYVLLVSTIAGTALIKSARLLLLGLPIILLPLFGLVLGISRHFDFLNGQWSDILFHLVTFAAFHPRLGIFFTVEILAVLAAFFIYFLIKANFRRAIFGALAAYFILALFAVQGKIIGDAWVKYPVSANLKQTQIYTALNFFVLMMLGVFLFWKIAPLKARAVFFNLRPERKLSLAAFSILMFWGANLAGGFYVLNLTVSFLIYAFFLSYAALSNDVSDINIDKITNPHRPYVKGILKKKEMVRLQRIVLGAIIVLVLIIDSAPILLMTAVNVGLSLMYSVLRLRKFLFSHLIAAAGEATVVLYGFFAQEPYGAKFSSEVWRLFFAIFVFLAFFLPVKELKDFEGDKKDGVKNFLTVFGWRKGKIITAISVFFSFILFSTLIGNQPFIFLSLIFAGLGACFVIYYERVGERASYINFLAFIMLYFFINFKF